MSLVGWLRPLVGLALAGLAALPTGAFACTVTDKVAMNAGPFSPAAVAASPGVLPQIAGSAGFACNTSVLVLLGGNYIRGTFSSANGMKLKNGVNVLSYTAAADSGGTVPLTSGTTIDYMQNNLLNLLGLLGGSNAALPLYVKPGIAAGLPYGDYIDKITIAWDWRICSVAYVAGACLGSLDKGTGSTEITVKVTIGAQDMTIALSSVTTWDPVNGTSRPMALPGSKGRTGLTVRNPDLVPLDGGSIALVYKVPAKTSVALDGDGTSSPTIMGFSDGSPASGTTFSYVAGSAIDDVEFSSDNGASWTYSPTPGNRASEAMVTHLRFRPKGAMKAGSSFTLSFPYLVR